MPEFFKVDVPYDITWVARDRGPRKGRRRARGDRKPMRIIARDIMPPDINPPEHRVVISSSTLRRRSTSAGPRSSMRLISSRRSSTTLHRSFRRV